MTIDHRTLTSDLARLVFLASQLQLAVPSAVHKNVPNGELIHTVAAEGITGAASQFDIPPQQLENLRDQGAQRGPASAQEFRVLLSKLAMITLEERRQHIHISSYMAMVNAISAFYLNDNGGAGIIDTQKLTLDKLHEDMEKMPKFNSGFTPLDLITGGFYQGICIITAKTGHGKTTCMLAMMKYLRETGQADEQWFFENEIPLPMMRWKLRHLQEGFFSENEVLHCGEIGIDALVDKAIAEPNPNRVIFIDSPDVMAGGSGEGKRYVLESLYRKFVTLKNHSKMVVVASQSKQKDREIELESNSDSFDKTRYTDMMIGWRRVRMLPDGFAEVIANVPKNRFGIPEQKIFFHFNYTTMDFRMVEDDRTELFEVIGDDDDSW